MKVTLLPSAPERSEHQFLTSFVINDVVAIDAGSLGLCREPEDQARIRHIFLTHSHADHTCSLPMFLTNVSEYANESIVVYGPPQTLDSLTRDVFNGRVWPDLCKFSRNGSPVLKLEALAPRQTVTLWDLKITAVPLNHVVPTFGYIVDDGAAAAVFSSDTGPTAEIWEVAGQLSHLKAVFMDAAFPDVMLNLATAAGHLTPQLFKEEVAKLPAQVAVLAIHIKPPHRSRIVEELAGLHLGNLAIAQSGHEYVF